MKLPKNAVVAVADGEVVHLYRNTGDESAVSLTLMPQPDVSTTSAGSGGRHHSSSANHADDQQDKDAFAAGVAALLNKQVLDGKIDALVVIAAPRTLGELRLHYHKALESNLVGEISKDLTGHAVGDVESAIASA